MKHTHTPPRAKPAGGTFKGSPMGVLCLLLDILLGRRIARLIQQLEDLFAAFRAGTLKLPEPRPCHAAMPEVAPRQGSVRAHSQHPARPRNRQRPAPKPVPAIGLRVAKPAQAYPFPASSRPRQPPIPARNTQILKIWNTRPRASARPNRSV